MCQQRNADQPDGDVAQKDYNERKQVALAGYVRLPRLQDVRSQGHMEAIGSTEQQVKPNQELLPAPDQMPNRETNNREDRIERKEIGRQRDQKVRFSYDHMAASRPYFEFFYPTSAQPCRQYMGQFLSKNVEPHRFWQEKENYEPAGCPAESRHPNRFRSAGHPQDQDE